MIELKVMITCIVVFGVVVVICAKYEEQEEDFAPWLQKTLGAIGLVAYLGVPISLLCAVWRS